MFLKYELTKSDKDYCLTWNEIRLEGPLPLLEGTYRKPILLNSLPRLLFIQWTNNISYSLFFCIWKNWYKNWKIKNNGLQILKCFNNALKGLADISSYIQMNNVNKVTVIFFLISFNKRFYHFIFKRIV